MSGPTPVPWLARGAALLAGALFGAGLGLSGMTRPDKVLAFLDIAGPWDPGLIFVMLGAISVHALLLRLITRLPRPVFEETFHFPTRRDLDRKLLGGAALFGVGWGLGGYCPGPALVSVSTGHTAPLVFVVTMAVGMWARQHPGRGRGASRGRARRT